MMCVGLVLRACMSTCFEFVEALQVGIVSSKLAGEHPTDILIRELTTRHASKKYWDGLKVCLNLRNVC